MEESKRGKKRKKRKVNCRFDLINEFSPGNIERDELALVMYTKELSLSQSCSQPAIAVESIRYLMMMMAGERGGK